MGWDGCAAWKSAQDVVSALKKDDGSVYFFDREYCILWSISYKNWPEEGVLFAAVISYKPEIRMWGYKEFDGVEFGFEPSTRYTHYEFNSEQTFSPRRLVVMMHANPCTSTLTS
jgi:hypothetical protein